jgi:hypothetical protein
MFEIEIREIFNSLNAMLDVINRKYDSFDHAPKSTRKHILDLFEKTIAFGMEEGYYEEEEDENELNELMRILKVKMRPFKLEELEDVEY